MAVTPGVRIGPYETISPIGAGGMGEVWKARDTRPGTGQPLTLSSEATTTLVTTTRWSPRGQIAYTGSKGIRVCGADGTGDRVLLADGVAGDFNRTGDLFYAFKQEGDDWKLLTVDVASGRVQRNIGIEESPEARIFSASLHPDGKRMAYTRNVLQYDIWILDGIPRPAAGWMKLFKHWIEP